MQLTRTGGRGGYECFGGLLFARKKICIFARLICILSIYIIKRVPMDASILDLRYKMKDVLKAINRRERVRILYHGKVKGEIVPTKSNRNLKTINHPIFGISKGEKGNPGDIVFKMRRSRVNDI
jgi:hypothetical protein